MSLSEYEAVIGLEIHVQLLTKSKLFSPASTQFGGYNNENISAICLGFPGTMPSINREAVRLAIRTGLALNCEVHSESVFSRKQYFYPDLSKGYQISQFDKPICGRGEVSFYLDEEKKFVTIERAHLEEDAGKSIHSGEYTAINYNRAGVPLLEIVTAPDIRSSLEAAEFVRTIRSIVRTIGVCDGNLEEGSMRCDCNVSIRKKGVSKLGTRVELKNINSFRFIEKAIDYEIHRQIDSLETGTKIVQETRLYDSTKNVTISMRTKEKADDYRYLPEPDILPLRLREEEIVREKESLPLGPTEKYEHYLYKVGLPSSEAYLLSREKSFSEFFDKTYAISKDARISANWIVGDFFRMLNEHKVSIEESPISPENLGVMIGKISSDEISGKIAKDVFLKMWKTSKSAPEVIDSFGFKQVSDNGQIELWVDQVLNENPDSIAEYRGGKKKVLGFFVGQIMKLSKGQASPSIVNQILRKKLDNE